MFPEHWNAKSTERLKITDMDSKKAIEDFNNNCEIKMFRNSMHRQVEGQEILFRINLEERRDKLRKLLEEEDLLIAEEHTRRIETMEERRDRLREYAKRIRNQKEIERRASAEEKYFQRDQLADDEIRLVQRDLHFAEIIKDWKKIKEIKERIKREEQCEAQFWAEKLREELKKKTERDQNDHSKIKHSQEELLNQLKDNEARKALEREEELKNRIFNSENIIKLQSEIAKEKMDAFLSDKKKKEDFRKALDRHIKIKNERMNREKEEESMFDKIMRDENAMKIKDDSYKMDKKKRETLKHLKNFIDQQNCIKKEKLQDNETLNAMVRKTDIENNKKFKELQYLQRKKYADLIKNINETHLDHLSKVKEEKRQKALELQKEKEAMNEFIKIELEKEEQKKQKEEEKRKAHNEDLLSQINFNKYLKELAKENKQHELNSLKEAEENYKRLLKDIKDKETLLFKHPWRSNINDVK